MMSRARLGKVLSSRKGFTLIELLAVMAIIGVLAAILTPIVSQSGESAREAQIRQDAGTLDGVVTSVFAERQSEPEVVSPELVSVTADINLESVAATTQNISTRYPELFITAAPSTTESVYRSEFPVDGSPTDTTVVKVTLIDLDAVAISRDSFFTGYTAIDFDGLEADGFVTDVPTSVGQVSAVNGNSYHSALWLLKKSTSASGETDDARSVVVFKLLRITVSSTGEITLDYGRIH